MKRLLTMLIMLALMAGMAHALLTYDQTYYLKNKRSILSGSSNDPLYNFIGEVDDVLSGTDGVNFILYTPTTAPTTAAKGQLYFDLASSNLKYYTTSWQTVAASTSSTLDEAYGAGNAIDVDGSAVTLTTSDTDDNVVFAIVQNEATNDNAAMTITLGTGATGSALTINSQTSGTDITGDNWSVVQTGAFTLVGITNTGTVNHDSANVFFDATDTGKDLEWDDSQECLHFLDNCILGIGGATTAAPDFAIKHDATDVDVIPAATSAIWKWGDGTNDIDMWWYGSAAGDYFWWDESGAELLFVDAHIGLADDGTVTYGTNDDWVVSCAVAKTLLMTPAQSDGTNVFAIGTATYTSDVLIYGETASTVTYDASADKVTYDAYDIMIGDGDIIEFGDGTTTDLDLYYDGTKDQLELLDNNGDATFQILGFEAKEARLILAADEDDDATDQWQISVDTSGVLAFGNDAVADTFTDYLSIAKATGLLTLKEGETISNNTDDSLIITSNDNNMTLIVMGEAAAKSAILDLSADAANDDVDTWLFTVADGGALTIANDATATMTVSEAMDITGTITLADDEILTNASDIVDITGDDGATTFAIRGCTGNFSAVLEISADDASDDADTWLFTVADGGALSIANDSTATMTINEVVDFTSTITLANDEVFANDADDEVSLTSDDNNTTFAVRGNANAKSAILELSGDDAADDVDTWLFTVADGGAMTIANDSTATMTINEVVALGSGMTSIPVVVTDAAGYTVTAANSGRVHIIGDLGQNCTIDLPAEAAGLYYVFVYAGGSADAHDHTIDSEHADNYFKGGVSFWDTDAGAGGDETHAGIYSDGNSNSKLTLNNAAAGTEVHMYCQDGTLWYVWGQVLSDTAPAFADQ